MPTVPARPLPDTDCDRLSPGAARPVDRGDLHVGLIMDGNRRWAEARGLPRLAGYQHGVEALRRSVKAAPGLGVRYLTVFGFSAENWRRPRLEVQHLMSLLRLYLDREVGALEDSGVRLRVIGERRRLGTELVRLIEQAEAATAGGQRLDLIVALSYGARQEMLAAVRQLSQDVAEGRLVPDDIGEGRFSAALQLDPPPDPHLIIRTSGERRLSNFLLWQAAQSELVFLDCYWPDFGAPELAAAIDDYRRRRQAPAGLDRARAG